jgi:hydrogenase maturation protease
MDRACPVSSRLDLVSLPLGKDTLGEDAPGENRPTTLVVGLGNPLRGDDGVGVRVVQALGERGLPEGVEVVDAGTPGLGLIGLMEGCQRVLVVDAANVNRIPGQFVRFTGDELLLRGDRQSLSIHAAGLEDALLLAQALDLLPRELIVFGVQPANLNWDSSLSPEVQASLPSLVEAVLSEVKNMPGTMP